MGELSLYAEPFILMGDFNAHMCENVDTRGRKLLNLIRLRNLVCLNKLEEPTYVHAGASTIIDYAIVSNSLALKCKFTLGDAAPESFHNSLNVIYRHGGPIGVLDPSSQLPHPSIPITNDLTGTDIKMRGLLSKIKATRQSDKDISMESPDLSMPTLRRQLRKLGKLKPTVEVLSEIADLRRQWRAGLKAKSKALRNQRYEDMFQIRGRKGYWNHINSTRNRKRPIPLDPNSVHVHFEKLYKGSSIASKPLQLGSFAARYGLPSNEPALLSRAEIENKYLLRANEDVLCGIPDDQLFELPIGSGEISFALTKMSNSALGEDKVLISDLKTLPALEIARFFVELTNEVPT